MRGITILALAGMTAMAAVPARADWIYTYDATVTHPATGYLVPTFGITLDVTNAAVQSGSFTLQGYGAVEPPGVAFSPHYTGDTADFMSLTVPGAGQATPAAFNSNGTFNVALTFDPATGAILSDQLRFTGSYENSTLSGDQSSTTGSLNTDDPACDRPHGQSNLCGLSGAWTVSTSTAATGQPALAGSPVPEPASFAMLGAGLVGLGMVRRR